MLNRRKCYCWLKGGDKNDKQEYSMPICFNLASIRQAACDYLNSLYYDIEEIEEIVLVKYRDETYEVDVLLIDLT